MAGWVDIYRCRPAKRGAWVAITHIPMTATIHETAIDLDSAQLRCLCYPYLLPAILKPSHNPSVIVTDDY